ncbi:hypothetical protein J1N35_004613 [Gossypium stocksii]|uniref:Uncharacterized protein n=1 Tax=Gossypium stocksii TaxID=47602 RepID=A0A9D3WD22_9ROSI|nr:hypothetical protein J1N35_004613 [Gossypium stocksii]
MKGLSSVINADTQVDARGLSSGKRMFQRSRGQNRVGMATIVVINELFNNDSRCQSERSITFTPPPQSLLTQESSYIHLVLDLQVRSRVLDFKQYCFSYLDSNYSRDILV